MTEEDKSGRTPRNTQETDFPFILSSPFFRFSLYLDLFACFFISLLITLEDRRHSSLTIHCTKRKRYDRAG